MVHPTGGFFEGPVQDGALWAQADALIASVEQERRPFTRVIHERGEGGNGPVLRPADHFEHSLRPVRAVGLHPGDGVGVFHGLEAAGDSEEAVFGLFDLDDE